MTPSEKQMLAEALKMMANINVQIAALNARLGGTSVAASTPAPTAPAVSRVQSDTLQLRENPEMDHAFGLYKPERATVNRGPLQMFGVQSTRSSRGAVTRGRSGR